MSKIDEFVFPNSPTCIVACSASEARVWLSTSRSGDWSELNYIENSAAALREKDIAADRPGRAFDSFGSGRHAMSPKQTGHEHQLHLFATDVSRFINESVARDTFAKIILIAGPRLLGLLRERLSKTASRALVLEVAKNPTNWNFDQVRDYFGLRRESDTRRA